MSHFANIELQITNAESLKLALENMGLTVESHILPQPLDTYWSDKASAHIIVRYKSNPQIGRSDIGFQLVDGKYQMLADDYEIRKGRTWDSQNVFTTQVKIEYGVAVATKAAQAKSMKVIRERNQDGRVQLRITPQKQLVVRR